EQDHFRRFLRLREEQSSHNASIGVRDDRERMMRNNQLFRRSRVSLTRSSQAFGEKLPRRLFMIAKESAVEGVQVRNHTKGIQGDGAPNVLRRVKAGVKALSDEY